MARRYLTCSRSYAFRMSDSPFSRAEIRAAAAADHELGPEYSDAVVASFLEKVNKEIDARVEVRLAAMRPATMRRQDPPADADSRRTLLKGIAVGIGVSGITAAAVGGNADERLQRLLLVLLVLAVLFAAVLGGAAWLGRRPGAAERRSSWLGS